MSKTFTIKAKMWMWPGDMPWHFVSLDKELSKNIREAYPKSAIVKVKSSIESADEEKVFTVNKKTKKEETLFWNTSLFRNKKDENYIMPIKKDIRKKLGIFAGEVLEIKIEIL
jgi:hypothetical protein